jgi:hypothetical protein
VKANKLPIHRGEILREEFVKLRGLSPNGGARLWLIFQTVGLFLVLTLCGYGQQSNAGSTFEATKEKAETGDVTAQDAMGVRYATGDGVRQSYFEAARWFRRAAKQGDVKAQYHLALYYYDGERIDYKEAMTWYRKAAEQGFAPAQNKLGVMCAEGRGGSKDLDEATKWFRCAAEQGDATAKANLAKTVQRKQVTGSWQVDSATLKLLQPPTTPQTTRPLRLVQSTNAITTTDGVTYKSVGILKAEPDGLVVEHSVQGGGIGVAKLRFENLSADLQQRYGYDIEKAAAYRTGQGEMQAQLRLELQAQQEQVWAAEKAREIDNFNARAEIDRLENERREAEAAQARAEAARVRAEQEWAQNEAARVQAANRQDQITQEIVEQGYQIRDIWQRSR